MRHGSIYLLLALFAATAPSPLGAQHEHRPGMHGDSATAATLTLPGQDAFGAMAEVVKRLRADPTTDWSKVDLERLRQHLIDMNEVTLRSRVVSTVVPGGVRMEVTGDGRACDAIRRMTSAHVHVLESEGLEGKVTPTPGGVRLTVTLRDTSDAGRAAELRGLGFIGIMTLGEHHPAHHLALARGALVGGH